MRGSLPDGLFLSRNAPARFFFGAERAVHSLLACVSRKPPHNRCVPAMFDKFSFSILPRSLACLLLVLVSACQPSPRSGLNHPTPLAASSREMSGTNPSAVDSSRPLAEKVVHGEIGPDFTSASNAKMAVSPSTNSWLGISAWCATNGFPGAGLVLFQGRHLLQTGRTVLDLVPGSPLAKWRGVNCWLAYPLRFASSGELIANALDIEKTIKPLLSVSSLAATTSSNDVIVIDPGHGGRNVGAQSVVDGRFEKELTLDLGLRLGRLLGNRGWTVAMTRTNDMELSVAERVAIADSLGAKLFLSLHFNSEESHRQSGIETYCMPPVGMHSHLVRDLSDKPHAAFPNNSFDDENLRFSICIHRAIVNASGRLDRGLRRARYPGVLRLQNRPAVLVEAGYLSNREEALLIGQQTYRQRLAEAMASALDEIRSAPRD